MQIQDSGAQVYFSCHNLGCGNAILCSLAIEQGLKSGDAKSSTRKLCGNLLIYVCIIFYLLSDTLV